MYSLTTSQTPGKQRVSPPSTPDGPRPAYSLLCDETRTLMIGCIRKICSVIQKNQRRIDERNRLADEEQHKSQAIQMASTNVRDLSTRFLMKIPFLHPQPPTTTSNQLKPVLPADIVEQLTATKEKFTELFRVNPTHSKENNHTRSILLDRSKYIRYHGS
jgi:hypothetical protein